MKKGASQVDWAISLGIFLLYLAWFFIFIRPAAEPPERATSLLSIVEEGLASIRWTVEIVPIFVRSNISASNEPIALKYSLGWANNSFAFSDEKFFHQDEQRLYFLASIKNTTNAFTLAHSGLNYSRKNITKDLSSSASSASVNGAGFRADFTDSMLSRITFSNNVKLRSFELKIDGKAIDNSLIRTRTTDSSSILAKYKFTTDAFNHSSIVFAENPRVYNYVDLNLPTESHTLGIEASLENFTNYFADNSNKKEIDYAASGCDTFTGNYVDFYSTANGLSFLMDASSNITVCHSPQALTVNIKLPIKNNSVYRIIAHSGDFSATQGLVNDLTAEFGLPDAIEGVSDELFNITNATAYGSLKTRFGYPAGRDFSFELLNASGATVSLYSLTFPDEFTNVFAKEFDTFILTKFGVLTKHKLRIRAW